MRYYINICMHILHFVLGLSDSGKDSMIYNTSHLSNS